jgi:hypothetical protein
VLGRQLQDQAAAIPEGEQVGQEQEHPQVGALSVHIGGHTGQRVGQLLPGQSRQHPRVGAQGIAVEAGGAGRLQALEVTGLGLLDAAGEIHRPAAAAVRKLQQGPAVVHKLQAVPQAAEGGVFQPGGLVMKVGVRCCRGGGAGGCGRPVAAGGGHWLLVGSGPLPEAVIGSGEGYAESAWFQSDHPGKRVDQKEGQGLLCGSVYEPGLMNHLPETDWHAVGL